MSGDNINDPKNNPSLDVDDVASSDIPTLGSDSIIDDTNAPEQHEDAYKNKHANNCQEQLLTFLRDDRTHREDSMGDHWSVPWSDLMMVMFILFASLVSVSAAQQRLAETSKENTDITDITDQQRSRQIPTFESLLQVDVYERSQRAVRNTDIENVQIDLLDDLSVKVSVRGPLFFDLGRDTLKPEVKTFLNELARVIVQTPYQVNVIGHTDNKPIQTSRFPSNWELSLMRATKVTRHLIDQGQIEPSRFTIMGRSKYEPANPNTNEKFSSLNRRVEIIITRTPFKVLEKKS